MTNEWDIEAIAQRILFEDNHLLVIDKPAGLLSQGDITGGPNVVDLLKEYRRRHENKPGEAFVGLVHRLDRTVSGVMALAKTSKAARRLSGDWNGPSVQKLYRALVPIDSAGALTLSATDGKREWTMLTDWLVKDPARNVVRLIGPDDRVTSQAQSATLQVRWVRAKNGVAELEVRLGTGRGHQIRVQLASRGMPILGDEKYGSKRSFKDETGQSRLALHAWRLVVPHPTKRDPLELTAALPAGWPFRPDDSTRSGFRWPNVSEPDGQVDGDRESDGGRFIERTE